MRFQVQSSKMIHLLRNSHSEPPPAQTPPPISGPSAPHHFRNGGSGSSRFDVHPETAHLGRTPWAAWPTDVGRDGRGWPVIAPGVDSLGCLSEPRHSLGSDAPVAVEYGGRPGHRFSEQVLKTEPEDWGGEEMRRVIHTYYSCTPGLRIMVEVE